MLEPICPMCASWRSTAGGLATALRPYTLFREQRVEAGRIVVHTVVPGSTLSRAILALDSLADLYLEESHKEAGIPDAA